MTLGLKQSVLPLLLLVAGVHGAHAQYSTPVGTGAAKPKTLRATAVLEWTGALEKPSASRLMPLAVWDGEHYQPASLYLARPEPLAFTPGTEYVLQRAGDEAGLFEVRTAAQLHGQWIGMGKYVPEAPPPPPKKLKASKQLPAVAGGHADDKMDKADKTDAVRDDRPTLHRKTGDDPAANTKAETKADTKAPPPAPSGSSSSGSSSSDAPTLHRRTSDDASKSGSTDDPDAAPKAAGNNAPAVDPDRPTLHTHHDASGEGTAADDPDRPTLHRSRDTSSAALATAPDPDRPHLRYGVPADTSEAMGPPKLEGAPPAMQQIVAVSDPGIAEQQRYLYTWPEPADAAKMQGALAAIALQAATAAAHTAPPAQKSFGPAAASRRRATHTTPPPHPDAGSLQDEHFAAYELSFSGGPTLVYSAHTAGEGAARVYVTLIAQPDFYGKPQVLFQQASRGDRLAETPVMQLIDAVDTDGDRRAELVFALLSGEGQDPAAPGFSASEGVSRQFAIYRVADRSVKEVFNTGPLP